MKIGQKTFERSGIWRFDRQKAYHCFAQLTISADLFRETISINDTNSIKILTVASEKITILSLGAHFKDSSLEGGRDKMFKNIEHRPMM
jgi:hypothetical protein